MLPKEAIGYIFSIAVLSALPTSTLAAIPPEPLPRCTATACIWHLASGPIMECPEVSPAPSPSFDDVGGPAVIFSAPCSYVGTSWSYQFYNVVPGYTDDDALLHDEPLYPVGEPFSIADIYTNSTCSVTIGGVRCNSCQPCSEPGRRVDCTNIALGKASDVCTSTYLAFYNPYLSLAPSSFPSTFPSRVAAPTPSLSSVVNLQSNKPTPAPQDEVVPPSIPAVSFGQENIPDVPTRTPRIPAIPFGQATIEESHDDDDTPQSMFGALFAMFVRTARTLTSMIASLQALSGMDVNHEP